MYSYTNFLPDDQIDESFYRWLYTGFTRAKSKLYLVNFDERFLKQKEAKKR